MDCTVRMIGATRVKNETSEFTDIPETSSTCKKKIQLGKQEMVKKNKEALCESEPNSVGTA